MSPDIAAALWSAMVAAPAFQPKRPSIIRPFDGLHTRRARPEIPSPSASPGSARAVTSDSAIASRSPSPIIGGATRGLVMTRGSSGP